MKGISNNMEYSDNFELNEIAKGSNGQRDIITWNKVLDYLGSDATDNKVKELLMDILNNVISISDVRHDIRMWEL